MKRRLIVDYDDQEMQTHEACYYALQATRQGKISEAHNVKPFCWTTVFRNGVEVFTRNKKTDYSADSLIIKRRGAGDASILNQTFTKERAGTPVERSRR